MDEKIEEKVGHWVYKENSNSIDFYFVYCSNCGEELRFRDNTGQKIHATKYCPNCGAKMDKPPFSNGGMRCRPIRIEVQNLVYLMGEWAIKNNMCWNDEHAKKLAYYILDNKYRKESDTAREIFEWLEKHCFFNGFEIVETYFKERYNLD